MGGLRWTSIWLQVPSAALGMAARECGVAADAETDSAIRNRLYLESNVSNGVDWRIRVPDAPRDARSLGMMESNGDKLTANRMKKRGMGWTIRGARRTAMVV